MLQYKAVLGQSIMDVCMNTYGSLDYYVKLINDNGLTPQDIPYSGQIFNWDENIIVDQTIYNATTKSGVIFATLPFN